MRERNVLFDRIQIIKNIEQELSDNRELIELGEDEGDDSVVLESENALKNLEKKIRKVQLESMLSGEADAFDAYLNVNSGAGGTEAQDWAQMLLRMYSRWSEKKGYKITVMEYNSGDEAGIKSATLKVSGHQAYGWLKTENGVHRLVRISPFDSNARRHTSFASVSIAPVIDDSIEVEINPADLKIDTYRSSGAGGQHVNTTDSAVRITHRPSGIVVACQTERSQHQNKANAMEMLKARLYEAELRKREEEAQGVYNEQTDIAWGHQIRSYVMQPYRMVKDLRTNFESTNVQAVMDGDIDDFLEASLASRLEIKED